MTSAWDRLGKSRIGMQPVDSPTNLNCFWIFDARRNVFWDAHAHGPKLTWRAWYYAVGQTASTEECGTNTEIIIFAQSQRLYSCFRHEYFN